MSAEGLGIASANPAKPFLEAQQFRTDFLKNASCYNSTQTAAHLLYEGTVFNKYLTHDMAVKLPIETCHSLVVVQTCS